MPQRTLPQRRMHAGLPWLAALLCVALAGCGGGPQAPTQARRYALKGTVISIDRLEQRIVVDHEEIPGFMAAMAMPYPVADAKLLDAVGPGDQVTADVVVTDTAARLENVVVVKKAEPAAPPTDAPPAAAAPK